MTGSHNHAALSHGRAFAVGIALNLGFVAVEATFGVISIVGLILTTVSLAVML